MSLSTRLGGVLQQHGLAVSRQLETEQPEFWIVRDSARIGTGPLWSGVPSTVAVEELKQSFAKFIPSYRGLCSARKDFHAGFAGHRPELLGSISRR